MNKIVISVLIIALALALSWGSNKSESNSASQSVIAHLSDSVEHYQNKAGETVSQNKALILTNKELKKNAEALKLSNKELKGLISLHKTEAESSGDGELSSEDVVANTEPIDSLSGEFSFNGMYEWSNGYLSIDSSSYSLTGDYLLKEGGVTFLNPEFKVSFNHKYSLSFSTTTYWKRDPKWNVFKPKFAVTDIKFDDPEMLVTSNKSIIVKPPKGILNRKITWIVVGGVIVKLILK